MTWTYSGNPAISSRDAVRFLVRDTVDTDQKLSDEEIAWLLSENGSNVYLAAIAAAENLVAIFSSKAKTRTVGSLSISYEARASEYRDVAADLRRRVNRGIGLAIAPYAGGISKADKELQEADTDWDPPAFKRGMHDHYGSDTNRLLYAEST